MSELLKNPKTLFLSYLVVLLGATLWPFNFVQPNRISPVPEGLSFAEPALAYARSGSGLEHVREFTLVIDLSTEIPGQAAWIFGFGTDFRRLNLLVGLYMNRLIVEVHRGTQIMRASIEDALRPGERSVLIATGTRSSLSVFVNGVLRREVRRESEADVDWEQGFPILLGARSDGKYAWTGSLYRVLLFDRILDPGIFGSGTGPDSVTAVLDYRLSDLNQGMIPNHGEGQVGPLVVPEQFTPYRRGLLMDLGESDTPFPIWTDITLNVFVFLPFGFLVMMFTRKRFRPVTAVLLVVAVSVCFSLSIEILQAYLPRRWSTFTDIWTNGLGGLIGAVLWFTGPGRAWNRWASSPLTNE